jgi:hypothetical protein
VNFSSSGQDQTEGLLRGLYQLMWYRPLFLKNLNQ